MAYKTFSRLSSRNQSNLITQLHKMISYYGEVFCSRERLYLKNLSKQENTIYWLEDEQKKLIASVIVDLNYTFDVDGIKLIPISHTVSKRPGQMDRIINHICTDYTDQNLVVPTRSIIASSIQLDNYGFFSMSPVEMVTFWPNLAQIKTDYFNTHNETLAAGLSRKNQNLYIRINQSTLENIKSSNPDLYSFINEKMESSEE